MTRVTDVDVRSKASSSREPAAEDSWQMRVAAAQLSPAGQAAIAVGCAVASVLTRFALDGWFLDERVYAIAVVATAFAALIAGWKAGLACAVLAQTSSNFFFMEPRGSFTSLLLDPEGVTFYLVTALMLVLTEMSVRAQRDLRTLLRRLHVADNAKAELLALIAHELRDPVSAMHVAISVLESDGSPAMREHAVGALRRQLLHIQRLTEDLTDASRIQSGKVALQIEEHRLHDLVSAAQEMVASSLARRGQQLKLQVDPTLTVRADSVRIVQVLANLLQNASKYSPEGSVISLDSRSHDSLVLIRVTDQGSGIPKEHLEGVFETYVQLNAGSEGLGLGLSLVRKLVHMHGGTIAAESNGAGEGSTFEIRLPAGPRVVAVRESN